MSTLLIFEIKEIFFGVNDELDISNYEIKIKEAVYNEKISNKISLLHDFEINDLKISIRILNNETVYGYGELSLNSNSFDSKNNFLRWISVIPVSNGKRTSVTVLNNSSRIKLSIKKDEIKKDLKINQSTKTNRKNSIKDGIQKDEVSFDKKEEKFETNNNAESKDDEDDEILNNFQNYHVLFKKDLGEKFLNNLPKSYGLLKNECKNLIDKTVQYQEVYRNTVENLVKMNKINKDFLRKYGIKLNLVNRKMRKLNDCNEKLNFKNLNENLNLNSENHIIDQKINIYKEEISRYEKLMKLDKDKIIVKNSKNRDLEKDKELILKIIQKLSSEQLRIKSVSPSGENNENIEQKSILNLIEIKKEVESRLISPKNEINHDNEKNIHQEITEYKSNEIIGLENETLEHDPLVNKIELSEGESEEAQNEDINETQNKNESREKEENNISENHIENQQLIENEINEKNEQITENFENEKIEENQNENNVQVEIKTESNNLQQEIMFQNSFEMKVDELSNDNKENSQEIEKANSEVKKQDYTEISEQLNTIEQQNEIENTPKTKNSLNRELKNSSNQKFYKDYVVDRVDNFDNKLNQYLNLYYAKKGNCTNKFKRISQGYYELGVHKVNIIFSKGKYLVKYGTGMLDLEKFIEFNSTLEQEKMKLISVSSKKPRKSDYIGNRSKTPIKKN